MTRGKSLAVDTVTRMAYQVRTELAAPRALAAARAVTTPQRLGTDMIAALDQVWPLLREQGARHGHNIVIYYTSAAGGELTIDAGVEVPGGFTPRGAVRPVDTPAGETAVVTHYGEYSDLAGAYAALEQWCAANGRRRAGTSWEVYGDWEEDPAKRRTDVYFLLEPSA